MCIDNGLHRDYNMIVPGRSLRQERRSRKAGFGVQISFIHPHGNILDKIARRTRLHFCAAARDSPFFDFNTDLFADLPLTLKFIFPQNRSCRPYAAAQNKISKQ